MKLHVFLLAETDGPISNVEFVRHMNVDMIYSLKAQNKFKWIVIDKIHKLHKSWNMSYVKPYYGIVHIGNKKMHDDVIKWKHFPRYWPLVRGIHRSPVNSPHKDQWRGALMFSLIYVCIDGWVNNREAGDLRRYCAHYDVTVMGFMSHCRETPRSDACSPSARTRPLHDIWL